MLFLNFLLSCSHAFQMFKALAMPMTGQVMENAPPKETLKEAANRALKETRPLI